MPSGIPPTGSSATPSSSVSTASPIYPPYAHALAGAGAGLSTVLLLHPLDTLRTRLQSSHLPVHVHPLRLARSIFVREGASALYRGAVPAAVGSVLSWATYFHVFHRVRGFTARLTPESPVTSHLFAGCLAGAVTSIATNPVWVVKVRLQMQGDLDGYRGFMDGLMRIGREEGMRGLYKGLMPSLLLVSHGAVQFTLYEKIKESLIGDGEVRVRDALVASTGSKLVASVGTYPLQVARTRMQERAADGNIYGKISRALWEIGKREGIRGLYRGLMANVARVTPQAAVTFVTYEQILKVCAKKEAARGD